MRICASWCVVAAAIVAMSPAAAQSGQPPAFGLRLTFVRAGAVGVGWEGRIALSAGRLLELTTEQGEADAATGRFGLKKPTKKNAKKARPGQLRALCAAPADARLSVETNHGQAAVAVGDLAPGQPRSFLDGRLTITRTTAAARLTEQDTEDDWPAAAAGPDGAVWVAYTAYQNGPEIDAERIHTQRAFDELVPKGNGDQLRLLRLAGGAWTGPYNVTGKGLDLWRPTVAVARDGSVWTAWSQNFDGDWDIVVRTFDPARERWSPPRRIRRPEGADLNPAAAADPKSGAVYLAWQGWRQGAFDIWIAQVDQTPVPKAITKTPANEWNPAAACDSRGGLHVVFDTYEKGDYDVKLVRGANTASPRTLPVAVSPLFEARASIAIDRRDRIWVAYEQGGPYWGKDFGTRWGRNFGQQFYLQRDIVVTCVDDSGRVRLAKGVVPAEPVMHRYTPSGQPGPRRKISVPRIAFDSAGDLWLLYRRHASTQGNGERWVSYATRHNGEGWTPPIPLSRSENQLDNRPAVVPAPGGGLLVIHSCDGRTSGTGSRQDNDLYATVLPGDGTETLPQLVLPPPPAPIPPGGHETEAEDIARMRAYRIEAGGKQYRLLRGEFHRHTELTSHRDQDGLLEEIWRYGLDVARMDWIGDGDHDNGGGKEYLWWLVQKQTDMFHHPPTFIPMFTYERSVVYPSGHRNVMFDHRGVRPLPRYPGGRTTLFGDPESGAPDIKTLYAYLRHFDGVCAVHTSATNMGTDWRDNDSEVEPVVEIYQGHRQNYEHHGAPGSAKDEKDSIGGYRPLGFVWNALMRGYRLGFEVSSDHISTHISYAVVLAEDTSRRAILDAFKKRHCYGANDNILLDVRCGDHLMGDEFELSGRPTFRIYAVGTAPIASVSIVRGVGNQTPEYVYTASPGRREIRIQWTDESPPRGQVAYYYVRIEQEKPEDAAYGALAWASPMWLHFK